ncbi:MAG: cyclic nucleotide-binding domain-containing protein [Burkholderiaceae bacterium]|nr:cyclic nucleotide-binding domain-containing protein [Burkholderiaceae bacterium]
MALGFLKPHDLPVNLRRLKNLSLFSTLTTRELKIVDGLLHVREFLAGEVIFDEGEEGQALYIITEGVVSVCREHDEVKETVAELTVGNFFGDLALLDNTPRTAQVRAKEACKLAVFFRADFISLMETDATIGYKISLQLARTLAERLRILMSGSPRLEAI